MTRPSLAQVGVVAWVAACCAWGLGSSCALSRPRPTWGSTPAFAVDVGDAPARRVYDLRADAGGAVSLWEPGGERVRDQAIDALAHGNPADDVRGPEAGAASQAQAAADVDTAIADGRTGSAGGNACTTCGGVGWVVPIGGGPSVLGYALCPACGGVRASER